MTTGKRRILTFTLFVLISYIGFAGGGDVPPPPPPTPPPGLSIGVDVFFLAGLALVLGVRKLLKSDRANF